MYVLHKKKELTGHWQTATGGNSKGKNKPPQIDNAKRKKKKIRTPFHDISATW
jgi:hypothetical protein